MNYNKKISWVGFGLFIVALIGTIITLMFLFKTTFVKESRYTYLSTDNKIGESRNCNISNDQMAYCIVKGEKIAVKQFYKK